MLCLRIHLSKNDKNRKVIIRKIIFCSLALLSGCANCSDYATGNLLVYSDLNRVKNKTVYYEVTDPAVITARVNRQIENALMTKGWRIVPKDKAGYVYTVSTDVQKYARTQYSVVSTEWGTYGESRSYTYHFRM